MKKSVLKINGTQKLSKKEKIAINGGAGFDRPCGGDGSFIFVDGKKVCCYIPFSGQYLC